MQTARSHCAAASQHLLDVDSLGAEGIFQLLDVAERYKKADAAGERFVNELAGSTVTNLFYEASTRTRISFQIAARKLGADVVNIAPAGSSITKGESLVDTVRTLEALGTDAIVIRHSEAGAPYLVARHFRGSVVNAGDGLHAHPTQALLDLLTVREAMGRLDDIRVAIVGDILHSRVARSTGIGLLLCGADVIFCGPRTLLPMAGWLSLLPGSGSASQTTSLEDAVDGANVVMSLRIQRERMSGGLIPSLKEFTASYGLDATRLADIAPQAWLMHPGPVNEGVELAPDTIVSEQSLIARQVENSVYVRMAVLSELIGGRN